MNKRSYSPSKEQKKFIEDRSAFLIVSAGPGSGKTETIINYLTKIAPNTKKEIIVCSFTRNSTNEIMSRFHNSNEDFSENLSFQTFDSFLINKIWKYYFNRIMNYAIHKFSVNTEPCKKIENNKIIYSKLRFDEFRSNYKNESWLKKQVEEFITYSKEKILHSGFISEYILRCFISENKEVQKYISSHFDRIIIDEAQDLSTLRYRILMEMHKIMKIKITLVGDERQSIYQFLGSNDYVFNWLGKEYKDIQMKKIVLTHNFRYKEINSVENKNIKQIFLSSNEAEFKNGVNIAIQNNDIQKPDNFPNYISKIKDWDHLFLAKTNKNVEKISEYLNIAKIKHKVVLRIPFEVPFEEQEFIEYLYLYNLLITHRIKKEQITSNIVEGISSFIWPYDNKANEKFRKLFWKKENNFDLIISQVKKITKIKRIEEVIKLYRENNNYIGGLPPQQVQVMTFHGAKGLEAQNVIINYWDIKNYLDSCSRSPSFQEVYVALSRTKNKLVLLDFGQDSYKPSTTHF